MYPMIALVWLYVTRRFEPDSSPLDAGVE